MKILNCKTQNCTQSKLAVLKAKMRKYARLTKVEVKDVTFLNIRSTEKLSLHVHMLKLVFNNNFNSTKKLVLGMVLRLHNKIDHQEDAKVTKGWFIASTCYGLQ